MTEFEYVDYTVDGNVGEISMNRPPVNAINMQMIGELLETFRLAKADDLVRSVILTSGIERAFSAGVDLDMASGITGTEHRAFQERLYFEYHNLQHHYGKPTIAAVTGPMVGGGITLAMGCNCVIMAEDVELSYPEIDVGHIPGSHFGPLPRLVGRHKAFELLFSGAAIDGKEANRLGIVNHAVEREDVLERSRKLAKTFAEKPPYVMQVAHNAFMQFVDEGVRRELGHVRDLSDFITNLDESHDAREKFFEEE